MVSGLDCDPQAMQAVSGSIAGPVVSDMLTAWAATQTAIAAPETFWPQQQEADTGVLPCTNPACRVLLSLALAHCLDCES